MKAGITLVETLVVLVLVGILAAVAIPSLSVSSAPREVLHEARRIHSALARTRSRAIAERREFRFALSDGVFELQFQEDGDWTSYGSSSEIPSWITVTIDGSGTGAVVFGPHGRADGLATIVVENGGYEQRVLVLAGGLVRWEGDDP